MKDHYILDSIAIEGFRGYLKPIKHDFQGKSVLIFGPQGSGKSSTLNAIEWGLFGKIAYFKSAESKSDIELINSRAINLECKVKVTLKNRQSVVEVTRTKRANSKESDINVRINGSTKIGKEAEEFLFNELGLTFDDFYRSVYLHQESIRALITDDPRNRDEAIDRLLGLERVRNIIGSIPLSKVKSSVDDLTNQREKITAKLQGAILQIDSEVKKAKDEARKEGFTDEQISSAQIGVMLEDLRDKTDKLASECRLESPEISSEVSTEIVSKLITKIKAFLRQCRKQIIEITGVDELRKRQSDLKQIKIDLERTTEDINNRKKDANLVKQEYGDLTAIERSLETANSQLSVLNSELDALDANVRLAKDALFFFEDPNLTKCPVCGQKVLYSEVKKHLEEVVEKVKERRANEIYENLRKAKEKIKSLTIKKEELISLERKISDLDKMFNSIKQKVSKISGVDVKIEDLSQEVEKKLSSLQINIDESNEVYRKRNEQIEDTDMFVDKIKAINNVLLKRAEYETMDKRAKEDTEESKGLSQAIHEIETFKRQLETLVTVLTEVQISSASQSISDTQYEIAKLYKQLRAHPYYNNLNISVTSKNVSGIQKNTYLIKASSAEESRDTFVSSRFSTGQINCAALAIFLSLAKLSTTGIGFILLDDPSQSLDYEHSEGLSEILAEIAKERQILVATQDEGLFKNLNKDFNINGNVMDIRFQPWSKNGCALED
jgi:DNA repair exonuclease SbcCD ATPase subunit